MRRKRRTSQGTWLPTIGDVIQDEPSVLARSGRTLSLAIGSGTSGFVTTAISVTTDRPQEDPTEAASLADVIGSEWFLKRIVGACFVWRKFGTKVTQNDPFVDAEGPVTVGCGFFVSRCDPLDPDSPIGFVDAETSYNPINEANIREPWIWRRTWILGNYGMQFLRPDYTSGAVQNDNEDVLGSFPPSNALYGSVADGPKIDAKTKRRISNDDRLFFAASICRAGIDSQETSFAARAGVYLDYRIFGQARKARNRGNF